MARGLIRGIQPLAQWYYNPETSLMHLDRDDRGNLQDLIQVDGVTNANPVNQETVTIRALTPVNTWNS